uniref:Uncharacterized protein n=1 Tax=viral metagenome TaxID=1070528 RepID=A0A6C0BL73_9ZZZZ
MRVAISIRLKEMIQVRSTDQFITPEANTYM